MKKYLNIDNRLYEGLKWESELSGSNMTQIINVAIARYLETVQYQEVIKKKLQANPDMMMQIVAEVVKKLPKFD